MAQAVELRGHVVVDEQGAAMPADLVRVGFWVVLDGQVFLPLLALGVAEGDDHARIVARPAEGFLIVGQTQVIDLADLRQAERFLDTVRRHGVERADLVVLAPRAPALTLGPALGLRRIFFFAAGSPGGNTPAESERDQ